MSKIKYLNKGCQLPYQANGIIEEYYFYFRARHDILSLTLYKNKRDHTNMENELYYKSKPGNSILSNEEAEKEIVNLYTKIIK